MRITPIYEEVLLPNLYLLKSNFERMQRETEKNPKQSNLGHVPAETTLPKQRKAKGLEARLFEDEHFFIVKTLFPDFKLVLIGETNESVYSFGT